MNFKSGKFTYQPLQESSDFRLLKLLSGEQDKTIKCSLSHSSLTSRPYYRAVSYTWGSPGDLREIELNGVAYDIQANLFDFLQQLYLTYGSITLWVDALCINQNDLKEKTIQVPLMGLIYSYAKSVLVWLGPQADDSEEYFDYCNQTAESDLLSKRPLNIHRQSLGASMRVDDTTASISAVIASLQHRIYWTRTWIIQEIVLASDIYVFCGNRSTHWPNFVLRMPENNTENQAIGMRNPTHPFGKLQKLRNIATRLTLRQLLFQCHMSKCSEPRDLIYGLLNITKDTSGNSNSIVPDYYCSLEILFLQTMSFCPLPQIEYDGIPCLHFCDTLATRLGLEPEQVVVCANDILQSSPLSELAIKLASRSYFAKLTRFGRFITQPALLNEKSSHDFASSPAQSRIQQSLERYTIRQLPGTKLRYRMWSFHVPETMDTIFLLNFESPNEPVYHLACICRPIHYNADEEGVIPYRVVGMGIMPHRCEENAKVEKEVDVQREVAVIRELLRRDLNSLDGRVVTDSIPGYGLEVTLPELISLCFFARRAGSFVQWSINDTTASDHWQWT